MSAPDEVVPLLDQIKSLTRSSISTRLPAGGTGAAAARKDVAVQDAAPHQLVQPAIPWDWAPAGIGTTSRDQVQFCDHQPLSCTTGIAYEASGSTFFASYALLVSMIDPRLFPQPDRLASATRLTTQPTCDPADSFAPDGWTRVTDGAGILRWAADWIVSSTPADWTCMPPNPGTMIVPISMAGNALSALNLNGPSAVSVAISADRWSRILVSPGAWYQGGGLVKLLSLTNPSPFRGNIAVAAALRMLRCRIADFRVAANPYLQVTLGGTVHPTVLSALREISSVKVAGIEFSALRAQPVTGAKTVLAARAATNDPQIVAVALESFS